MTLSAPSPAVLNMRPGHNSSSFTPAPGTVKQLSCSARSDLAVAFALLKASADDLPCSFRRRSSGYRSSKACRVEQQAGHQKKWRSNNRG
jgi:hypothetical protein